MSLGFGLKHTVDFSGLQGSELLDDDITNADNMVYSRVKLDDSDDCSSSAHAQTNNRTRQPPRRNDGGPWWNKMFAPPLSRKTTQPQQQQSNGIPSIGSISMQRAECTRQAPMSASKTDNGLLDKKLHGPKKETEAWHPYRD